MISLTDFSSNNTNPKWLVNVAVLNPSSVVWAETFDAFLEWNLSFHIPTAYCGTLKNDVALNAN